MEPLDPQPEDVILKQAIRRALGAPSAPPQLRGRIEALLAAEHQKEQVKAVVAPSWRKPMLGMVAAAAVVLVGLGIAFVLLDRGNQVPEYFANAMVVTHDQDSQMSIPADASLDTIRAELKKQLGHPVLVAPLGGDWQFQGASVSKISGVPAAHLLFKRGDETISIFSVSAGAFYLDNTRGDGTTYAQMDQGHPISGFVQGGAIHCLVGSSKSGKLSLKEVTALRDQIRSQVQ